MARLSWGHKSRQCIYCWKVGPRTAVAGGFAHMRCIPRTTIKREQRQAEWRSIAKAEMKKMDREITARTYAQRFYGLKRARKHNSFVKVKIRSFLQGVAWERKRKDG